jgi:hypothetical protein
MPMASAVVPTIAAGRQTVRESEAIPATSSNSATAATAKKMRSIRIIQES